MKLAFAALVLLIFAICFAMFLLNREPDNGRGIAAVQTTAETVLPGTAESTPTVTETTEVTTPPETTAVTEPPKRDTGGNPVPETDDAGPDYYQDAAFVGDSIMTGLSLNGLIDGSRVLASKGMNIEKISTDVLSLPQGQMTAIDAIAALQPKKVFIMLGSNGIAWLSNEDMVASYGAFIDNIHAKAPDATICILSIPPVAVKNNYKIKNESIPAYNQALLNLADDKGVRLIDFHSAMTGSDGYLATEYAAKDGMHFQRAAYEKMLSYLRTHAPGA